MAHRLINHRLTLTSLFSGGGGDCEGMRLAGYNPLIAANHWPVAIRTHQANHPDTEPRCANLSETDFRTFPRTDVAWISPSCVWHARSGGRVQPPAEIEQRREDPGSIDRATAFAVIAATEVHKYAGVIVENVPEFTAWSLFPWWLDGMTALGYKHQITVLNSADVGPNPVAQHRRRVYIVFTHTGDVDLTPDPIERTPATAILDPNPGALVTRRMYITPQLEQITEPEVPHLVTYRRNAKARRADRHQLATVTAGGNHHAVATLGADGRMRQRLLNNRERARAQGFPDSYVFHGTPDEQRKQIGNAVSVNVAQFLGTRLAEALAAA